jgi:DNA mismatch repair protein MutS2
VLLKTLGLAGVCARTGFPFPATDHPQVPFFDSFFADLGDPQSLEQHLSSFSGHILKFKTILEKVTDRSLVLIDELNTATDPEEGAALGRAFLETLMARGAMVVTTTHDPHLKGLAVSDSRILNASMAFDEGTRTPTYRMVLGVPGRSRALETAERLGIPEEVLLLAKKYLSKEHQQFESLLSKLEHETQTASSARKEAVHLREEAERLKKEWTERTEASVNEMMERTRLRLRRILEQAQDEVRTSVRKLDELQSRREIDKTRSQLNQTFSAAASHLDTALQEEAPEIAQVLSQKSQAKVLETPALPALQVGGTVRIPKWKNTGKVLEIVGNKVRVAMGTLQMTLSPSEVEPISAPEPAKPKKQVSLASLDKPPTPPSQIDLRGVRLEEAMSDLEKYLDQAYRSGGLQSVTIVHGLGTGAIREGARKLLKELPYVKEFRDGGPGQGGTGATIVEFDLA